MEAVIIMTEVISLLNGRANAQKKISKDVDCSTIIKFINMINSLDEDESMLESRYSFDEILIPNEFIDFIMPSAIRVNPLDKRTNDLLDHDSLTSDEDVTVKDFRNACDLFRGAFKLDAYQNVTPLSNIRKPVALFDVVDKLSVKGMVKPSNSPFIPIPVVGCDVLLGGRLLLDKADDVIKDYINMVKFI